MSDDKEDVVEVMGPQEVQTHHIGIQARQQMKDPTELLIASGRARVDEAKVDNTARKINKYV